MSCTQCGSKFSFLRKELGCASCGRVFCSDCLKQKCVVPHKGESKQSVCKKCYLEITGEKPRSTSLPFAPPDIFLKRLEELENPSAPPIIVYKHSPKTRALRAGLSKADQDILDRLEKLKNDGKGPPPSESELRERLEKLIREESGNGEEPSTAGADTRGVARSVSLEKNDTESEVDKLTKKVLDEVHLDQKASASLGRNMDDTPEDPDKEDKDDELPWCVLCNEDAQFRCLDCGGDLYCRKCNIEVHKEFDCKDHKFVPFEKKTDE